MFYTPSQQHYGVHGPNIEWHSVINPDKIDVKCVHFHAVTLFLPMKPHILKDCIYTGEYIIDKTFTHMT